MTQTAPSPTITPRDLPKLFGVPLSDEQLAAATAPLAPQLIVAGAGTGKTTVMAARVVWLLATGQVRPHQVLGLTFTNKAAGELRHRIRAATDRLGSGALPDDGGDPSVLTYHAFAGRLLSDYGPLLGVESDARLLADGQRARLAYSVACHPADIRGLTGNPTQLAERVRAMDDSCADMGISLAELRSHDTDLLRHLEQAGGPNGLTGKMVAAAEQRLALTVLTAQFRTAKRDAELIDFADQVRLADELAHVAPLVRDQVRSQFRVVLLDEYQDTSRAQRRMLQALFDGGHPVTAVGDPCQAIYGWRGASVTNIDEFPRHFPSSQGDAPVYSLTINRRSLPSVLAAANSVAADLRGFHRVAPLRAPADAGGGRVRCGLLAGWDDELVWLGDQLAETAARFAWSDMAVLCRSNDQVAAVVDHLRSIAVPCHVSSRRDLLALPEVVAVTALLRVLVDPYANPDLIHHLVGPRWRIGPVDLAILGRRARDLADPDSRPGGGLGDQPHSLHDAVHDPGCEPDYPYSPEARTRLAALAAELDQLASMSDRAPADTVSAIVDLLTPALLPLDSAQVPDSLPALVTMAQHFRGLDGSRTLSDFVAHLDDCARFSASPEEPPGPPGAGVAVMTMHAAKGLEFPVVALPFLSAGVFPAAQGSSRWVTSALALPPVVPDEPDPALELGFPGTAFTTADHDEYVAACRRDDRRDEDRLAYVAVTRAKRELIASGHWWGPTQHRPRGPSDYLRVLRDHCEPGAVTDWMADPGERPEPTSRAAELLRPWPQPAGRAAARELAEAISTAGPLTDRRWRERIRDLTAERHATPGTAVSPEVWSASALLSWLRDPEQYTDTMLRPMPRRPSAAARAGVAFHSWMEHRIGQQTLFDLPDSSDDDLFAAQLARTAYADRTPHAVEQPFVIAVSDLVVTGRIDAVFRVTDRDDFDWEVVDWKTGTSAVADPGQLVLYRAAWARMIGCDPRRVRATFVFLADGSHVTYDDLVAPDQLLRGHPVSPAGSQ